MIEASDIESGEWVERNERKIGGSHTIEGRCPCCADPMLIDVRELIERTTHGLNPGANQAKQRWSIDEKGEFHWNRNPHMHPESVTSRSDTYWANNLIENDMRADIDESG